MAQHHARLASGTALSLLLSLGAGAAFAQDTALEEETVVLDTVVITAEEQGRQSLGVSTVTADDIERQSVVNDISEVVRKMPGVNLTGASATGQRGNQRQIDIRGMGPENTLILVDGKPVLSRNSVKMGRGGERDTRGDSNWVPAEMIERIEVLRGPAAARYGSGAAGGVVNIITKRPETEILAFGMHMNQPSASAEGNDYRLNMMWAKPLTDNLYLRLSGNYNRSNPDDPDINASVACDPADTSCTPPAGVEGVINKDVSALLSWAPSDANSFDFEAGFSRQDNLYAGDRQLGGSNATAQELAEQGANTNQMKRRTFAVTHAGTYGAIDSRSYLQWEHTDNTRYAEGTAGSGEGLISSDQRWINSDLDAVTGKTEWNLPGTVFGREARHTIGAEIRYERLYDPNTSTSSLTFLDGTDISTSTDPASRRSTTEQTLIGIYGESNIAWTDTVTITPALRLDWSNYFGLNISGGVNASWEISPEWTAKVGVARAFKAPNLYQLNPDYIYSTNGNGCPYPYYRQGPCWVLGNEDLDPETSLNKEIGIAYQGLDNGLSGTFTVFHNDYRDKIQSGMNQIAWLPVGTAQNRVYQWENVPKALVSGWEGSLSKEFNDTMRLSVNTTYMMQSKNKETGDPLSLVPKYTVNASLEWLATEKLTVIPSLTHYGRIKAASKSPTTGYDAANTDARAAYTIFNLATRYQLRDNVSLSAGVTNLFDKEILREGSAQGAGANTFNEPGRAIYIGLNTTF